LRTHGTRCHAYEILELSQAAGDDEMFLLLVLAGVIEQGSN
jgi:hypothetical protein